MFIDYWLINQYNYIGDVMSNNYYKKIIELVEKKRNNLFKIYNNRIFLKKIINKYLNKYDELLLELYSQYEVFLENKK